MNMDDTSYKNAAAQYIVGSSLHLTVKHSAGDRSACPCVIDDHIWLAVDTAVGYTLPEANLWGKPAIQRSQVGTPS